MNMVGMQRLPKEASALVSNYRVGANCGDIAALYRQQTLEARERDVCRRH
jgi:hypothetical protein